MTDMTLSLPVASLALRSLPRAAFHEMSMVMESLSAHLLPAEVALPPCLQRRLGGAFPAVSTVWGVV